MNATQKRIEKNLLKTVDFALCESASGVRRLSPSEIKSLSEVVNASRPPVFHVLNTLINQYAFLSEFDAPPNERAAIERFLTAFREQAAADLMSKSVTLQDGLRMRVTPNV